ncbi:DUF732 domain-containing protein [Mycobacterium sp.]|uniref:DUF732 domain-containing protein n=1 Tax=Mycobacterium sp. TaxID=1785 RepID=UPI0025CF1682|nr:DUF732 domain-containing protein [Mycobacterium sp.]
MNKTLSVLTAVWTAAAVSAAPASADDDGYLRYLNDHGTRVMAFNDATKIAYGYQACGMLRNGMSIDAIAGASPISDGRGIADAAQHELCPDTLHH